MTEEPSTAEEQEEEAGGKSRECIVDEEETYRIKAKKDEDRLMNFGHCSKGAYCELLQDGPGYV